MVIWSDKSTGKKSQYKYKAGRQKKDGGWHTVSFYTSEMLPAPCVIEGEFKVMKASRGFIMDCFARGDISIVAPEPDTKEIEYIGKYYSLTPRQSHAVVEAQGVDALIKLNPQLATQALGKQAGAKVQRKLNDIKDIMSKHLGISASWAKSILKEHKDFKEDPYCIAGQFPVKKIDAVVKDAKLPDGERAYHISEALREAAEKSGRFLNTNKELWHVFIKVYGNSRESTLFAQILRRYFVSPQKDWHIAKHTYDNICQLRAICKRLPLVTRGNRTDHNPDLAPKQNAAIQRALAGNAIIAGSAGTGKTTTSLHLMDALDELGLNYLVLAPTGKATQRIREVTGRDAYTIHSVLYGHMTGKLSEPIDYLIVDESSMIDINLMSELMTTAWTDDRNIVLFGDTKQLPPIGPGSPFLELVEQGGSHVIVLDQVFRQSSSSPVLQVANGIINETKQLGDVEFIQETDRDRVLDYIVKNPVDLVITPYRRGTLGCNEINAELTKGAVGGFKGMHGTFVKGDVVIQTENVYDGLQSVYNGDTGTVISADKSGCTVDFGRTIREYNRYTSYHLEHARCLTVHKSQGSEWNSVLLVLPDRWGAEDFIKKEMLYTAVTRAKINLRIIGSRKILQPIRYKIHKHQPIWR